MAYISFKPTDFFNTKLWSGNSSTQSITGVGFQPDYISVKRRNTGANNWRTANAIEGSLYSMMWNLGNESSSLANTITSFDADGFSLGNNASYVSNFNETGGTYVGYNWKMATTSGITAGTQTITPTSYRINTTSKQGIYKFTGNGTSGATIAHGLGGTPGLIMVKKVSASGSWMVYHKSMGGTKTGYLESAGAFGSGTAVWNSVDQGSTYITLGNDGDVNGSGADFLMYVFCDVPGYFYSGQYLGNGENGDPSPMINCGFQPAFVIIKEADSGSGWCIWDNKRPDENPGYWNPNSNFLQAQDTGVESNNTNLSLDFKGTGFKIANSAGDTNGNGNHYLVMAWGNQPLIGSGGTPGLAR